MRLSAEALIDSQNWFGDLHPQPTFAAHCTRQHRLAEIVAPAREKRPQCTPEPVSTGGHNTRACAREETGGYCPGNPSPLALGDSVRPRVERRSFGDWLGYAGKQGFGDSGNEKVLHARCLPRYTYPWSPGVPPPLATFGDCFNRVGLGRLPGTGVSCAGLHS